MASARSSISQHPCFQFFSPSSLSSRPVVEGESREGGLRRGWGSFFNAVFPVQCRRNGVFAFRVWLVKGSWRAVPSVFGIGSVFVNTQMQNLVPIDLFVDTLENNWNVILVVQFHYQERLDL
jgi:hypothetical protein